MKIIDASHRDHGLQPAHLDYIATRFADRTGKFTETFELPEHLPNVPCGLYGPMMGDRPVPSMEITMEQRPGRAYTSRMVNRRHRATRSVTVIAGPYQEEACVMWTAFGGPLTPREPDDPTLPEEERGESIAFWAEHALAYPWLSASTITAADIRWLKGIAHGHDRELERLCTNMLAEPSGLAAEDRLRREHRHGLAMIVNVLRVAIGDEPTRPRGLLLAITRMDEHPPWEALPWKTTSWDNERISVEGTPTDDFLPAAIVQVLAYHDTGRDDEGLAVAMVELEDGRVVGWESRRGVTGSGFSRDAYGGDAVVIFARSSLDILPHFTDAGRELFRKGQAARG